MHRLDRNIPDLKQHIDNLKEKSIDPEKETLLQNTIEAWEDLDEKLQEDVDEMKTKIQEHDTALGTLTHESVGLKIQTGQLQEIASDLTDRVTEQEERLNITSTDSERIERQTNAQEEEIQSLTGKFVKSEIIQDQLIDELTEANDAVTVHESRLNDIERVTHDTRDEVTILRDNQGKSVFDYKF